MQHREMNMSKALDEDHAKFNLLKSTTDELTMEQKKTIKGLLADNEKLNADVRDLNQQIKNFEDEKECYWENIEDHYDHQRSS